MKKADPSKTSKSAKDVVAERKPQSTKNGPTELSADDLKNVSGGLPRGGGWQTQTVPKKDA